MMPTRTPGQTRRNLLRKQLARTDDYGIVLVLILVTIIVVAGAVGPVGQVLGVVLSGGTLLFVLHTSEAKGRTFTASAIVVTAAVLTSAGAVLFGDAAGASIARLVGLMLAVIAPLVILRRIALSPTITFRLVLGALAIYLLLGVAYSYVFPLVAALTGEPFFVQTDAPGTAEYLYFSYTTLATIGYGDYTAATSVGRMIAVSEGLVGQLYLVSAVALLVGNIGRSMSRAGPRAAAEVPADAPPGAPDRAE